MYTVKQLADLAGISVRTLHYYDTIGLFKPSVVGGNGYRYYDDAAVIRLQQVLFFRELGFSLDAITTILDQTDFDVLDALHTHRAALRDKVKRLNDLIRTIDSTILHLTGEMTMSDQQLFAGFTPDEEQRYAQEARERWGAEEVDASYKRWNSYTQHKKDQILAEGGAIYAELVSHMGEGATSPAVQDLIARWHQHMRYFYEPSVERLRGLGQLYVDHPDFAANFRAMHPDLPEFMRDVITVYCDRLEGNDGH